MTDSATASAPTEPGKEPQRPSIGRVAMVIQRFRPYFGGQGVQVEELARGLAARGVHTTVLTAVRGGPGGAERCDGYTVRRLRADLLPGSSERSNLWMPTYGLRVLGALIRARPDVVHVHGPTDGMLGAWVYGRLTGVPLIAEMTLMGDDDPLSLRDRKVRAARLRWRAYRGYEAWVAMSAAFLDSSRQAGLPLDRVWVIPQAVDSERFRPSHDDERARARIELGIAPSAEVAVFVGSLGRRKGVDLLLDAWPRVRQQRPGAVLVLVGGRPADRSETDRDIARRLDARPEGILELGLRDDPETALSAADLFVFPSRREGFGAVIIEAMASGVVPIVAELPGISDFVLGTGADRIGEVVPQENPPAIAAAVIDLLADPGRRARLGARARERVVERFALDVVVDRYLELYGSVLRGIRR